MERSKIKVFGSYIVDEKLLKGCTSFTIVLIETHRYDAISIWSTFLCDIETNKFYWERNFGTDYISAKEDLINRSNGINLKG